MNIIEMLNSKTPGTLVINEARHNPSNSYPQIIDLIGVPQEFEWHPEGDVDEHTLQVMNYMDYICYRESITGHKRQLLVTSALCHDLGKPKCTTVKTFDDGTTRIVSPRHDTYTKPTETLLRDMGLLLFADDFNFVLGMVRLHMRHIGWKNVSRPSAKSLRKFKRQLAEYGMTVYDLDMMVEADISGRGSKPKMKSAIMQKAIVWVTEDEKPKATGNSGQINGQFLKVMGYNPGPKFKEIIEGANKMDSIAESIFWIKQNYPK